ncbi:MAG: hypothetical protein ABI743_04945 [bacterium]
MRVLMFVVATVALSWIFEFSRVLLGMREVEPTGWTTFGLVASTILFGLAVFVYGFYEYKQEKAKGTVRRIVGVYETAIAMAEEARARKGETESDKPVTETSSKE